MVMEKGVTEPPSERVGLALRAGQTVHSRTRGASSNAGGPVPAFPEGQTIRECETAVRGPESAPCGLRTRGVANPHSGMPRPIKKPSRSCESTACHRPGWEMVRNSPIQALL
jgi:hypothetical protein